MFENNIFNNKKILITGNTGFKGSWLTIWLNLLGAKLYGLSNNIPTKPSLYEEGNLDGVIQNNILDIRDLTKVSNLINTIQPDFIFHLAAQPLVSASYINPSDTWQTNVMGTVNVLDSLRVLDKKCISVLITSDKCYENQEWEWGYRETDRLGGDDPYSASKGSAELVIKSYIASFFSTTKCSKIKVSSARAGNVIGGGDWAKNRIVPDCVRAWSKNKPVKIKSPNSTRPFQHVLEPLSGYLCLAEKLATDEDFNGQSFNFGPNSDANYRVIDVVNALSKSWPESKWEVNTIKKNEFKESKLLKLNCDKALSLLKWKPILNFEQTILLTSKWYFEFYNNKNINIFDQCCEQIKFFNNLIQN